MPDLSHLLSATSVPAPPSAATLLAAQLEHSALHLLPNQILHHLHGVHFAADSFNPGMGSGRFHPFKDMLGNWVPTYYAADSEVGAYCETVFRAHDPNGLSPSVVPSKLLNQQSYAQLQLRRPLQLAHLQGSTLRQLGVTRAALLEPGILHYAASAAWAAAIHQHYPALHGLAWLSRQHDASICYLLFGDRVQSSDLQVLQTLELASPSGRMRADVVAQSLGIVISR